MSYGFYKVLHLVGLVLFFSQFALAAGRDGKNKLQMIVTGVALVFIIVSGMGLLARLGFMHGDGFPFWVKAKLGIWVLIGVSSHMVLKRFWQKAQYYLWAMYGLLILAAYMAIYKP